jgi:hypothetical protein
MCGEAFLFNLQGAGLTKCLFGMRRGIGREMVWIDGCTRGVGVREVRGGEREVVM